MRRYRVRINGRNFLLRFVDPVKSERKHGFYTTRDVEAESFEDAEMRAVELVRCEEGIRSITINESNDPPMLYVDEIWIPDDESEWIRGFGYSYYPDDDEPENS